MTKGNEIEIRAEIEEYTYQDTSMGGQIEDPEIDIGYWICLFKNNKILTKFCIHNEKEEAEEICRRINEPICVVCRDEGTIEERNRIVDLIEGMKGKRDSIELNGKDYFGKRDVCYIDRYELLRRISQKEGE